MKKLILIFIGVLLLTGCNSIMNTPTKKVEKFLNKYQTLDQEVLTQLDTLVDNEATYNSNQKEEYKEVLKRQYKNITYTIKDETVDGNKATVETEIEVYDYNKAIDEANNYVSLNSKDFLGTNNTVDDSKVIDYKLTKLKDTKEKIRYTINFNLTKEKDVWTLQTLSTEDLNKIHGIYR